MKSLSLPHRKTKTRLSAAVLAILMILSCSVGCSDQEPITENSITDAYVSNKQDASIKIKAELTENTLSSLKKRAKVFLFEFTPDMDAATDINTLSPIAEKKAGSNVEFELPLYDGIRSRRYSSFALASYDSDASKYILLTSLHALNLDSGKRNDTIPERSIKGLVSDDVAGAIQLGISHTLLDVNIEQLLLAAWEEDAVPYIYNGTTFYLRGSVLDFLDEATRAYTDAGVNVYFRFLLNAIPEDMTNTVPGLAMPGVTSGAYHYLVNMENADIALRMEGLFDFLAHRYSEQADEHNGICQSFVIGKNVNASEKYSNAGNISMNEFIVTYEKLVRTAHTALLTYNSPCDAHAYISLDSNLSGAVSGSNWQGQPFLSVFAAEAALRGDFEWYVACELYSNTPTLWAQSSDSLHRLTANSLDQLSDLLDIKKYKYKGTYSRKVLISNIEIPSVISTGSGSVGYVEENQAASYVYAYYRAVEADFIEAMIYGAYTDHDNTASGLLPTKDATVLGSTRKIYEVFRIIDTNDSSAANELASDTIGVTFSQLASSVGDKARPVTRFYGRNDTSASSKDANTLYTFSGDMCGFLSTPGVSHIEFINSEQLGTSYLNAVLEFDHAADSAGIYISTSAKDFAKAKQIIIPLYAGDPATARNNNSVTIRIVRQSRGRVSESNGELIYESTASGISGGHWQTVSYDISDFSSVINSDDILLISLTAHVPGASTASLGIQSISVAGSANSSALGIILVIVIVIILVGIAAVVVYMLLKRKGIIGYNRHASRNSRPSTNNRSAANRVSSDTRRPSDRNDRYGHEESSVKCSQSDRYPPYDSYDD